MGSDDGLGIVLGVMVGLLMWACFIKLIFWVIAL